MNELQDIVVPKENVNDEYIIINSIMFNNGDKVSKNDIIATIETSKTDFSVESDFDGYIYYFCKIGDEVPVGNSIAKIFDTIKESEEAPISSNTNNASTDKKLPEQSSLYVHDPEFSKPAKELFDANGISIDVFRNKTFVTKSDVLAYLESINKTVIVKQFQAPITIVPDNVTIEKVSPSKKREISYLGSGQNAGLTCTFSININNEGILNHSRKHHKFFKLTIIPSLISEVSKLLVKFPLLNAYFENDQIAKYNEINIGYAIDINHGLKVVTLYNTSNLTVHEIEDELNSKLEKYSSQKLEVNDLVNSTFTITDLSKSGIHYFQPLINKGQSAILGISSIDFKTNSFNVSITFDHRVTEGKVVGAFLNSLKTNIEKYYKESSSYINQKENILALTKRIDAQIKENKFDPEEQAMILKEILKTMI